MSWIKKILHCRRTFVSLTGVLCLTVLGIYNHSTEIATSIAAICIGLGAANASQAVGTKKFESQAQPQESTSGE
jgi:uncharacterized membrane protein YjjB (DUF3815 family)